MTPLVKLLLTVVAVVATAVGAAWAYRAFKAADCPTPPTATSSAEPVGGPVNSKDPSYWNDDRQRSASPEDMPRVPRC